MTSGYEWPGINFTKYKIRVLHALKQKDRDSQDLKRISGYSGSGYQVKKNILEEALDSNLVCRTDSDLYSLTGKGEWVLDQLMKYRNLDVLDVRKIQSKKESSLEW